MSIYNREKYYTLPITRSYVKSWGLLEAVRELIQNALDSPSAMQWFYENETLSIVSEHSRLEPRSLLLGCTTKSDDTNAIGSFGEGYKLAMLVLLRMGYEPKILNNEFVWTPEFYMHKDFGMEILRIKETLNNTNLKRLVFEVNHVSPEDMNSIRDTCLHMQQNIGAIKETSKGLILMDKAHASKLYVGGLYICRTELIHGYDIRPEFIKLERDRRTIDGWDLKYLTQQMWIETEDYEVLARMMENNLPDVEYIKFSTPEIVKDACYNLFKQKHPGKIAVNDQAELDQLVKRGLTNTVYISGGTYYNALTNSKEYLKEYDNIVKKEVPVTPEEFVTVWVNKYKKHVRRLGIIGLKELVDMSKKWQVKANR